MSATMTAPAAESITTAETCDRCGSRAAIIASKGQARLAFCGHHARDNHTALLGASFVVRKA